VQDCCGLDGFGFNAGSALAANGLAGAAFLNTNTATAVATVSWMVVEWLHAKKPTVLGLASGAVAGLVAITPAAGFVNVSGANYNWYSSRRCTVFCSCFP